MSSLPSFRIILLGSLMVASVLPVLALEPDTSQSAVGEPVAPVALIIKKSLVNSNAGKIAEKKDEKTKASTEKAAKVKVAKEKVPFYFNPFKRIAHDSKVILTPLIENVGGRLRAPKII
jgi:hypothetical protein